MSGQAIIKGDVVFTGNLLPSSDNAQDLGDATKQWRTLRITGGTIYINGVPLAREATTGKLTWNGVPVAETTATGDVKIDKVGDETAELVVSGARASMGGHSSRIKLFAPASPAATNQKNFMIVNQNATATGSENTLRIRALNDDGSTLARELMAFEPSTGDVGIGTTSPGAKLEVAGQVKITGGAPGNGKILTSDAGGLASWQTSALSTTLASGEFTPTCTPDLNVSQCSINAGSWRYIRVGDTVQVTGRIIVQSTVVNQLSRAKLSLPIPSDFIDTQDASGGGGRFVFDGEPTAQFHVSADSISNDISLYFLHTDATNWEGHVSYMYRVR